ncbi:hypothetical protein M3J09_006229 [Ascochyta lentis]
MHMSNHNPDPLSTPHPPNLAPHPKPNQLGNSNTPMRPRRTTNRNRNRHLPLPPHPHNSHKLLHRPLDLPPRPLVPHYYLLHRPRNPRVQFAHPHRRHEERSRVDRV